MAESYENNGYSTSDFKRNSNQESKNENQDGEIGEDAPKLNDKAGEYMKELLSEKIKIDQEKFPMSTKLIDQEVTKVQTSGRIPPRDFKYVDVCREKPVKVTVKVLVPVKEHPKFNFVGKLLGPKGNTMKQLQEETMCKMAVLGSGSMRDKRQESEFRNSLDPKYAHLSDELHVEISALAPPAEAHARIAYALAEVKKYLVPDSNDMIRQSQMRDIVERGDRPYPSGPRGGPPPPHGRGPPRMPSGPPPSRPMPPKNKVFSILDRARNAMETYPGYDDPYGAAEPPVRGPPRVAHEPDYYGYERNERYYEEEPYYEKEVAPREYKPASARDVGTRRSGQQPPRHFARASPYNRPAKSAHGAKKQSYHGQQ